jgi:hypothetical protein
VPAVFNPVSLCPFCNLVPVRPCALQSVTDSMARHAQQAQRLVQHDRSLTPAVCAVVAGPVPSITQCLRGLAEIR